MRKLLLPVIIATMCSYNYVNAQNCSFINASVSIENTQQLVNGDCEITFEFAFDVKVNPGEKYIYIHMWKNANYPNYNYVSNAAPTNATILGNTVLNIGIDNSGASPALITAYNADNTVTLQHPGNTAAISIDKTSSATAGADRFIIKHMKVKNPSSLCGNALLYKADAWSTNSSNGTVVHCASTKVAVGIIDPTVSGSCLDAARPHTYSFSISTTSPSQQVYYSVYLDNGNNLFDPANDQLLTSISAADAITISSGSPFNSGQLSYPTILSSFTQKVFVNVTVVGPPSFSINAQILPCPSALPVTLRNFAATRTKSGAALTWLTETEQNTTGFEIQRQKDGGFEKVGFVPTKAPGGSSSAALNYNFSDDVSARGKWILYRLKQMDLDGHYAYSEIRKVYFEGGKGFSISPNPSPNRRTNIVVSPDLNKIDVIVMNTQGVVVKSFTNSTEKNIPLSDLTSGFYIVKVIDKLNNVVYSEKLIVQ